MSLFVFTWNPDKWEWPEDDFANAVAWTAAGDIYQSTWSVGGRKYGIGAGDEVMLLRQRRDRGIVGHGTITSELFDDPHWDGTSRVTRYVTVDWASILDPADALPVETLKAKAPTVIWDRIQGSGVQIPDEAAREVEQVWRDHLLSVKGHAG